MKQPQRSPLPLKTYLQCTLARRDDLREFEQFLRLLSSEGFHGIELNLPALDIIPPRELLDLLRSYGLTLYMLATGAYARLHGLSLSDPDRERRRAAVSGCRENIDYAAAAGCGVILGFFKGGPGQDPGARDRLIDSLGELSGYVAKRGVTILLEATNRLETSVACTLEDTLAILDQVGCPCFGPLPDTYHIHLEEPPVERALCAYAGRFSHLHISDDNRAFPGLGSLDFTSIYRRLYETGYQGSVAVEGNVLVSQLEDTKRTAAYLRGINRGAFARPKAI